MKKLQWEMFETRNDPRNKAWSNMGGCARTKVPGGWVLLHVSKGSTGIPESESMIFVPCKEGAWDEILEPKEPTK